MRSCAYGRQSGRTQFPQNTTDMPSPTVTDPTRCPLCGQPNGCAVEAERASGQPQPPCWCTQVAFAPALLAQVPPAARRQACICRACAEGAAPAADSA